MTRGMGVGMDKAHDAILRYGPGGTTGVTRTGDVIAGATTELVTRVGGYGTIRGRTTTGLIAGATTGGDIEETVAIDLCGVLKFGIAGDRVSQLRDTSPSSTHRGVKQLSLS